VNPWPAFFRRIPGMVSLTYLRPAAWADSMGSLTTSTGGFRLGRVRLCTFRSTRFQRCRVAMFSQDLMICSDLQLEDTIILIKPT
jgi:hypothetical protein